ncbi:MAG: serine/threonine-protein kinase [Actinomycetes bacterium]
MTASLSSASSHAPSVPGYRTRQILGIGSSGEVWSAVELSSGQSVALKLVHVREADRASVRRECMTGRRIDHPHVLRLRTVVEAGPDALALVLDYAPGGSLAALVGARGPLEPGEVVTVLTPLATALADLHDRGLVHGDVSPGNILFAEDGRPLLSDLGVASLVGVAPADLHGTAGYTDPAVLSGLPPAPSSDVFGLCAVGWHALTGRPPQPSASRPPLVSLAPDAPAALVAVLEQGMNPLPSQRPDAATLAVEVFDATGAAPVRLVPTDLGAAAADVVTHRLRVQAARDSRGGDDAPAASRRTRRRSVLALGGAVAVLLAGATYGVLATDLLPVGRTGDAGIVAVSAERQGDGDGKAAEVTGGKAATDARAESAGSSGFEATPGGAATPTIETTAGLVPDLLAILSGEDPLTAVPALAQLRAAAFATGDDKPLALADAPGSASLESDRNVLRGLANEGIVLEGLSFEVQHTELVSRSPESAVVRVEVVTREHKRVQRSDGEVVEVRPRGEPVSSELTLVRVDGRWSVSTVA